MMITDTATVSSSRFFSDTALVPMARRSTQQEVRFANRATVPSSTKATAGIAPESDTAADSSNGSNHNPKKRQAQEFMFLFGGTLSPADLAYLDEILGLHGLGGSIVAGVDGERDKLSNSSTRVSSDCNPEGFTDQPTKLQMAAAIAEHMGVKCHRLAMPIGIARTDEFLQTLRTFGATTKKTRLQSERHGLVLRLASNNRVLTNRRVVVYGEEIDFVVGMVSLLLEAGMLPVLCASRSDPLQLRRSLEITTPELHTRTCVVQAECFHDLQAEVLAARADALIANRDACEFAQRMRIPFVCAGRPLCNHNGDFDIIQIGYRGAMQVLDRLESAFEEPRNRHRIPEKR
jgi:hypothetical protein